MKPVTLWSVSLTTSQTTADALSDALNENAVSLTVMAPPRSDKADIEAIYDSEPNAQELQTRIAIMASLHKIKTPKLHIKQLPKLDWLKKVAEDFPPLPIARWVVFGAQHKARAASHRLIPLQIDATSAFGTGEHPTTRGCMVMLDILLKASFKPKHMLDMGCGSGILAMAYAKTTHGKAYGVDLDADSVEIARGNIRANGLRENMRVALGNGYKSPLVRAQKPYDLIMANIFAGPLCKMAYELKQHLKPGGYAILSGLLNHQANRVISAHRMQGLTLLKHIKFGEWSVLAFKRP